MVTSRFPYIFALILPATLLAGCARHITSNSDDRSGGQTTSARGNPAEVTPESVPSEAATSALAQPTASEKVARADAMAVYKSRLVPVGKPAPAFSLRQLGGGRASTSSLRGHVVLLSFWTASCPPCHAEAPHLQRLHDTYRKRGVRIVGVTPLTPLEEIHGFVARHGLTYPIAVDPGENVVRRYGLRGYPALVLLDRRGVVRWTHPGYKTGDERTVERKIAALLQG